MLLDDWFNLNHASLDKPCLRKRNGTCVPHVFGLYKQLVRPWPLMSSTSPSPFLAIWRGAIENYCRKLTRLLFGTFLKIGLRKPLPNFWFYDNWSGDSQKSKHPQSNLKMVKYLRQVKRYTYAPKFCNFFPIFRNFGTREYMAIITNITFCEFHEIGGISI